MCGNWFLTASIFCIAVGGIICNEAVAKWKEEICYFVSLKCQKTGSQPPKNLTILLMVITCVLFGSVELKIFQYKTLINFFYKYMLNSILYDINHQVLLSAVAPNPKLRSFDIFWKVVLTTYPSTIRHWRCLNIGPSETFSLD